LFTRNIAKHFGAFFRVTKQAKDIIPAGHVSVVFTLFSNGDKKKKKITSEKPKLDKIDFSVSFVKTKVKTVCLVLYRVLGDLFLAGLLSRIPEMKSP
jgi:hypothetical protein